MIWFSKKKKPEKKPSREELIAQAMKNARGARDRLGDETIQKMAAAMQKKENSVTEKAKAEIKAMDAGHVADNLKIIIKEK